jgi:hypothetical protein
MNPLNAAAEDWDLLRTFFPAQWRELAKTTGALKGLRQDKSEEHFLRVLLVHVGCGHSLRETVTRARQAKLADLSDVSLLKRLRKSKDWLQALCLELVGEQASGPELSTALPLQVVDSTLVKEPGQTGSLWRIHYCLQWPGLKCDHFKLTPTEGKGTGEALSQYPLRRGQHLLADRGYCHASDLHYAAQAGAFTLVRLNPGAIRLETETGQPFPLLARLKGVVKTGQRCEWPVWVPLAGRPALRARLCLVRKSKVAIARSLKKLERKANKDGRTLEAATRRHAEFVMVLTTFAPAKFPLAHVLECYRFRWQIELLFKRFKQLAQLGHLPKYDEDSSQAWLYGKLFVALLTEKLIAHARAFSPWGYELPPPPPQPLA